MRVVSLACGSHHTLAISETNRLMVCGKGNEGQIGQGDLSDRHAMCFVRSLRYGEIASKESLNNLVYLSYRQTFEPDSHNLPFRV